MNLTGFAQALITNIGLIMGLNDPQMKVTPVGFTKMLLDNPTRTEIANLKEIRNGKERELKVRYMQRGTESETVTTDDCNIEISPEWKETTIGRPLFRKLGIYISDDDMRKYQDEATATLSAGNPSAPMMNALLQTITVKANAIIQAMDTDLVSAMSTRWGVNAATGVATPTTLKFGVNGVTSFDDGFVKLLKHSEINEINGKLNVVGNGIFGNVNIANILKAAPGANGYDIARAVQFYNFYNDNKTASAWGTNHFGVFSEGSVGLVDFNQFVGPFAGERGGSLFFTLPIPIQLANGELSSLVLDAQLKYFDCPTKIGAETYKRGWVIYLSKSFGLFTAPTDMYADGDPLKGTNGLLHYIAANE